MSASNKLWDPIRSQWVASTPEERVRQALLRKMVDELGFPKGLIAVEKEMSGRRRFDAVVYAHRGGELKPLLLIECKAEILNESAISQAFGYNEKIRAPFLLIATENEVQMFWKEREKLTSIPFLPRYEALLTQGVKE